MHAPTKKEIKAAHDKVVAAGPHSKLLEALINVITTDPTIDEMLTKLVIGPAIGMTLSPELATALKGMFGSAALFGLQLGMHIGEARCQSMLETHGNALQE